jgi:hypothetical protein
MNGSIAARGLLVVLVALALAGCGGGGSNSSSDPGSASYDPATTTLKDAGLEVCSEETRDLPPTMTSIQGVGATRAFYVAKDCKGAKTTPNTIAVVQFTSKDTFASGTQTIKSALPNAAVTQHYPLVIAATGPAKEANLAAVEQQLPPTTTTSG